jgi:hypothetical protein
MSTEKTTNSESKILKDPMQEIIGGGNKSHFDRLTDEQIENLGGPMRKRPMEKYHDEPKTTSTPEDDDVSLQEEDTK